MPVQSTDTTPYWATSATFPQFARLAEDLVTDVVVVGAGMTGLSAAYLLAKAGKRVVVLERDRCAMTDTGHTSAHLTMVTDVRLTELVKRFGRNHAQAVWDAGLAAIATIDEVVREQSIDAGFEWVDGYLHAPLDGETSQEPERLQEDATLARELGFDAEYVETVPLVNRPGIRFPDQARIHPRSYLAGVAKAFVALGGRIYEHSAADEFCDDPRAVKVAGYTVRCEDVVIATHNPLVGLAGLAGATLFQTKLALYTSYVIAGRVPSGAIADALWWDTSDPYHFLRIEPHRDFDVVIFGGEDHKTGQQDDTAGLFSSPRRASDRDPSSRRGHTSLVGPGDRDTRWSAVYRAERRPSVRRHRVCRQRPDVRDVGRYHRSRTPSSGDRIPGPSCSIRAGRLSLADSGTTSRRTSITRIT